MILAAIISTGTAFLTNGVETSFDFTIMLSNVTQLS